MKVHLLAERPPAKSMHPLSTTMRLAEIPFGPFTFATLRDHFLIANGLKPTKNGPADPKKLNLFLPHDSWLSSETIQFCKSYADEAIFLDNAGHPVAFRCRGDLPATALPEIPLPGIACRIRYPWQLLDVVAAAGNDLEMPLPFPSSVIRKTADSDGELWCGENTKVLPGVYVEGRVFIGNNCKIGPNAYLRGPLFIGDDCRIGQAVEIKACLVMNRTAIGHLSYVGDSVIGPHVNFGAGTITANLRHDGAGVKSLVEGELIDTGRRKLGTVMGEGVHTGIHTSIYPGRKLSAGAGTRPGDVVSGDIGI